MTRERERKAGERREEDFASRWSRMKRGARAEAEAPAAEPESAPPPATGGRDQRSDGEILRELGLPDPESLKPGDDIRGFMASGVPARIRNRVLRRLWVSNPALANLDGLVDYGDDFTDAAMVPAVLQTAYKVGRGWARDAAEEVPAEQAEGDGPGAEDAAAPQTATPETASSRGKPEAKSQEESGEELMPAPEDAVASAGAGEDPQATREWAARGAGDSDRRPAVRRMRFRFADE